MARHSTEEDERPQVVNVIAFDEVHRAVEFLQRAAALAKKNELSLVDAVLVSRDDDGKLRVHETSDLGPKKGALEGGVWGIVLGTLLLGPAGGLATGAITAGVGGLLGRMAEQGVDSAFLDDVKTHVAPGRTAVVLLTAGGDRKAITGLLQDFAPAELLYSDLPDEVKEAARAALQDHGQHEQVTVTTDPPA